MSILDSILGNNGILGGNSGSGGTGQNAQESSSTHDFNSVTATDPSFGLSVHDLLHSSQSDGGNGSGGDTSDFTGLGSLSTGFSVPTVIGVSSTNHESNASESHGSNGGLLGGLL